MTEEEKERKRLKECEEASMRISRILASKHRPQDLQPINNNGSPTQQEKSNLRQPKVLDNKPVKALNQLKIEGLYADADELFTNPSTLFDDLTQFDKELKDNVMAVVDNLGGGTSAGYKFEDYIADLFEQMGYTATVTQKSYDFGIDVKVKNELFSIGIQCKHQKESELVGNNAVQEVVAGIHYHKLDKGMVITNSHFHKSCKILAERNNVILWDREMLYRKIVELNKK